MTNLLFILVGFLTSFTITMHPQHVSSTIVNFNTETSTIQISTKIFLDDIENDLRRYGYDELKLCTNYESSDGEQAVEEYLMKNVHVIVGQDTLELDYLGKEVSHDYAAVWCYMESKQISIPKKIAISVDYLYDIYDDQQNLVIYKVDNKRISDELLIEQSQFLLIE